MVLVADICAWGICFCSSHCSHLDNESLSFMELLNRGVGDDGHGKPPHFRYLIYFVLRTVFDWKDIKLYTLAKVKYTLARNKTFDKLV